MTRLHGTTRPAEKEDIMSWLEKINRTGDIHRIPPEAYDELAAEIREFLVQKVSQHGGHLASTLGAVELTMALHLDRLGRRPSVLHT